ncbi:MAG: hypothetical protein JW983_05195 [Elusimicrobia bacterium]|nr:hypothetical protein [Elusimicrobiota bacterium]
MPDTFAITILFLIISTAVAAFIKGRTKDKCLKGFLGNLVTIEMKDGNTVQGIFIVESTGLELDYPESDIKKGGECSYIMYKNEYPNITAIIRPVDKLTEKENKKREKDFKKTYHPTWFGKIIRKIRNLFATIRDSINEIINLLIGRIAAGGAGGRIISGQQKYITQMHQEFTGTLNTSYEPLLEKNIGHRVIVVIKKNDKPENISGILKEYTAQFLTLMDVEYPKNNGKSDVIIPRNYGIVRHLID